MSTFLSRIHETIRSARTTRRGATAHPDQVPHGLHKEYPRMPRIALPQPISPNIGLSEALVSRRSFSTALSVDGFSENEIGTMVGLALGVEKPPLRHYPSGGALFPIETYLVGNVLKMAPAGVFHYNPTAHALECLVNVPHFSTFDYTTTQSTPPGSALMIFTSVWERSRAKYGDLAYLHAAIECGHMAQNILLVATALGIATRPLAGFRDTEVSTLLDLGNDEQPVYAILLAHGAPAYDKEISDE